MPNDHTPLQPDSALNADDDPEHGGPDAGSTPTPDHDSPADETTNDSGGCGPETLGISLVTVGLVLSLAIPLAFLVGWIPVMIGIVILKRRPRG